MRLSDWQALASSWQEHRRESIADWKSVANLLEISCKIRQASGKGQVRGICSLRAAEKQIATYLSNNAFHELAFSC